MFGHCVSISNVIPRSNDLSGSGNRSSLGLYRKKLSTSSLCLTTMGMQRGWILILSRELHPVSDSLGNFEIHNSSQIYREKLLRRYFTSHFICSVSSKHFSIYSYVTYPNGYTICYSRFYLNCRTIKF